MNRKKVLIVDDNEIILKTLSMKLKAADFDVVTAADGSAAVGAVRQERPDLILLDVSFPPDVAHGGGVPWDGFRIIQWLRRIDEKRQIPIIIISGGEAEKYRAKALAEGAVAYFQKPVDHDQLIIAMRTTLDNPKIAPKPSHGSARTA
jgi:two-component system KDP operon response regulator KdpE